MQVIVDKHTVKINKNEIVNEGEYNVQACNFQFSSEYDGLPKIAIFKTDTVTKQILLSGDSCITPSEVLESTGIVGLGVYAYENDGDNLILRYSPTPAVFTVEPGSYDEGDTPTPPTPSEIEQLQAQITENANNISSLQDVTSTHTTQIETLQTDVNNIKAEQITQNQNIQTNTNNIQTNTTDIENIKSEQTTQNQNISQNTNDITNIKSEQVTQNTNIQNNTNNISALQTDLSSEITNRQNADINLQSQIDAITSSSDVVDIVGTYAQLQSYDTQHLQNNDVIKVLQDETHDNAMTYYRWLKNTSTWQYIGQEGPYYTKSETDTLLQGKANVNDVYSKSQIDTKLEDYALKSDLTDFVTEEDVDTKLEDYVETTTYTQGQAAQDANIEENATNINWLQTLVNQMPTVSGQGTDLSLQDVLNYRLMKFLPQGVSSQFSTTGKNLFDKNTETTGAYINASGSIVSGYGYSYSALIPVSQTDYIVSGTCGGAQGLSSFNKRMHGYDENGVWIEQIASLSISRDTPFTLPFTISNPDIKYIRFSNLISDTNIQIEQGSTATSYEPYTGGVPAPNPSYPYPVKSVTGENSLVISNVNLFDKNNANILNAYINTTNETIISNTNARTLYISCKPNTEYTIKRIAGKRFCVISTVELPANNVVGTVQVYNHTSSSLTITTGVNDKYLCVFYYLSTADTLTEQEILDSIMIVKGSTVPNEYVPHEEQIKILSLGNIELNSSPDGTVRDEIIGTPNNWLKREYIGKTTDVSGSTSITINDMVSDSGFYSYYGGTLNGKTIMYASAISGTNTILYQKSQYTDIPITGTTLINQLNDIYYNAHSYNGVTNITTTYADGNEQMYLDIEALKNVWSEV